MFPCFLLAHICFTFCWLCDDRCGTLSSYTQPNRREWRFNTFVTNCLEATTLLGDWDVKTVCRYLYLEWRMLTMNTGPFQSWFIREKPSGTQGPIESQQPLNRILRHRQRWYRDDIAESWFFPSPSKFSLSYVWWTDLESCRASEGKHSVGFSATSVDEPDAVLSAWRCVILELYSVQYPAWLMHKDVSSSSLKIRLVSKRKYIRRSSHDSRK